jgi:hypothetical protein
MRLHLWRVNRSGTRLAAAVVRGVESGFKVADLKLSKANVWEVEACHL